VQAVVQLEPAHAADEATAATLFGHLRAVLAPFKHPRCIAFADTLPRTETGKLLKAQLKAEFGGKPAGFARPYRSLTDAA
jgi:acyl-coenzyme A synthetase/AMP-(fatty) acid ligase